MDGVTMRVFCDLLVKTLGKLPSVARAWEVDTDVYVELHTGEVFRLATYREE